MPCVSAAALACEVPSACSLNFLWQGAGLGLERAVVLRLPSSARGVSAFLVRSLFADLLPPHQHSAGGSPDVDRGRNPHPVMGSTSLRS